VSTSELRSKARVRDVNYESSRKTLLADNSGNVYSKADRKSNRYSRPGGAGGSKRPTSLASVQTTRTRTLTNRDARKSPLTGRGSTRQTPQKAISNSYRAPNKGKTPGTKSRAKTPGYDTSQRSPNAARAQKRSSQPKAPVNYTRQRNAVAANKPAKQPRQVTSRNTSGQKPVRNYSAPAQKQQSPSGAPRSKKSGSQKSYSAQKSSRNSSQKSGYQRSASKSNRGGGKRSSGQAR
jgi:hypothetical protein